MAKMMKKKSKMMIVSLSSGMAPKRACISTLSPLIEEMVLSGLITRNTLSPERSTPLEVLSLSPATSTLPYYSPAIISLMSVRYPDKTITKSRIFQES